MRTEELANKLQHFFPSEKGYSAIPTEQTKPNGKRVFTYSAITGGITNQNYRNHILTEVGLTPSPLIDEDKCWWGAIDIDTYNMEGTRKIWKSQIGCGGNWNGHNRLTQTVCI